MKTCRDCKHYQLESSWCEKWEKYFDEDEQECDEFESYDFSESDISAQEMAEYEFEAGFYD